MNTKMSCGVLVKPTVVDLDGNILREYDESSNMITDYGMNRMGVVPFSAFLNYFLIGTGTTPTHRKTSGIVLSRSGTTITSDSPFFTHDDYVFRRILQFSDDSYSEIVEFISDTEVVISETMTTGNFGGVIWNVEQELMDEYYSYTSTVDTTVAGSNGHEWIEDPGVSITKNIWRSLKRDFTNETEPITITEAGWADVKYGATKSTKLFGRIVFDTPVVVNPNERLVIKVTMQRSMPIGHSASIGAGIFNQPGTIEDAGLIATNTYGSSYVDSAGAVCSSYANYVLMLFDPGHATNHWYRIYITGGSANQTIEKGRYGYKYNSLEIQSHAAITTGVVSGSITSIQFGSRYNNLLRWVPDTPIVIPANCKIKLQAIATWNRVLKPYEE